MQREKKWLTLNAHGKFCLNQYIRSISGTDMLDTQITYLLNKDLLGYRLNFKDKSYREELAGYCLTDLGIYTSAHYFPKFRDWDIAIKHIENNHPIKQ